MKATLFVTHMTVILMLLTIPVSAGETMLLEHASGPGWMPDGSAILCSHYDAGGDGHFVIVAVPPSGGAPDTLIEDPYGAYFPMPLSDGRHVVYYRVREIPTYTQEFVIHDLDDDPPVVWPVTSVWDDYGFTLSPDESEVLYTTMGDEIWALNLGDGSTRFIREGFHGAISPDGAWLAFGFETAEGGSISVAPIGGGPAEALAFGWWPDWSPDGEYLVFSGDIGGGDFAMDLNVVSRGGLRKEQLTDDPEWDFMLAVSPLGDKVAFIKTPGEFERHDLYVVDVDFSSISTRSTTWGDVKRLFR